MFTKLPLRIGAFLIVVMTMQTFGSEVEYISKPELDGFKSTECSQDCMLHGMLGGRLVQLRRDQDGTPELQLVRDDSILDAFVKAGTLQGEFSQTALSIVIEQWDNEFLAYLDTGSCVQDCSLLIRLENTNALVVRGAKGKPRLVWPSNLVELSNERILEQRSALPISQAILQSGDDYANCAGDGGNPMKIDPSKTVRKVISCRCFKFIDTATGISEEVVKKVIEYQFFNCEGVPIGVLTETYEYVIELGDTCLTTCPFGSNW